MPTCRMLITLKETKEILAKHFKIDPSEVSTFELRQLFIDGLFGSNDEIEENSYIFQFDKEDCE